MDYTYCGPRSGLTGLNTIVVELLPEAIELALLLGTRDSRRMHDGRSQLNDSSQGSARVDLDAGGAFRDPRRNRKPRGQGNEKAQ